MRSWVSLVALAILLSSFAPARAAYEPSPALYQIEIRDEQITMSDGGALAVTYYLPKGLERAPVLLEMLPYRKDDSFYGRDYSLYSYFVKRGYAVAKVDVRGTGGSAGAVPDREYSDREIADAEELIHTLATAPFSTGKVGMFGISWSGFNAIITAMNKPKELAAILAVNASDDLFHDDVHFIDGIFHVDEYEFTIDHENALPRSPAYALDPDYFADRFDREPWFFMYRRQAKDGPFWKAKSLRGRYADLKTPAYLIGGLLDGYRDSVPRMLENVKVPVLAQMGPWNHAWPDNGAPGPNYEWRHEAIRWWDYWLKGMDSGILKEPRFALFVREGQPPDSELKTTAGHWRYEEWPIQRTRWTKLYLSGKKTLRRATSGGVKPEKLTYDPASGISLGFWWGEPTGDMAAADTGALVFDSPVLKEAQELVGLPRAFLKAAVSAKLAHFVVRVEDVAPDGKVAFVTGGALNGLLRDGREKPKELKPNAWMDLKIPLRFTTWTFQAGHRIRIAVTNAQFPMFWPSPQRMELKLMVNHERSRVELPLVPRAKKRVTPNWLPPEPREERGDFREGAGVSLIEALTDIEKMVSEVKWRIESDYDVRGRKYRNGSELVWSVGQGDPARASFRGQGAYQIMDGERRLELRTTLEMSTRENGVGIFFEREILENGVSVRKKDWSDWVPFAQ